MLSLGQARPEKLRRGDRFAAFLWAFFGRVFSALGPRFTFWFFSGVLTVPIRKSSNETLISKNVSLAFPDMAGADQAALVDKIVRELPRAMAELMLQNFWRRAGDRVTRHNLDAPWLQPYARNEKQALFLLGHFSGWEANIMMLSKKLSGVHAVYAPPKNLLLETYFNERRTDFSGNWTLYPRDQKGLQRLMARKCAEGRSLLYALDAPLPGPMLPFMGQTSPTALRPYELAAKAGMPVIPLKCGRDRDKIGFWIEAQDPIFAKGTSDDDIRDLAIRMNDHYSDWIRENPDHWYWTGQFFQPNKRWEARSKRKTAAKKTPPKQNAN